jgi:hypothetical protein
LRKFVLEPGSSTPRIPVRNIAIIDSVYPESGNLIPSRELIFVSVLYAGNGAEISKRIEEGDPSVICNETVRGGVGEIQIS